MSQQTTTENLPDGLAALQKKRTAPARRTIEPSRNPAQRAPYVPPTPVEPVVDLTEPAASTSQPAAPEKPVRAPRRAPAKAAVAEETNRLTVYVDDGHDQFMDEAKFAGARHRPKVDVSRSAVVRFALDRLQEQMSAQQVADAIAAKPVDAKAIGRKRR